MSAQYYFEQCQRCINQAVEIHTHDGVVHRGIVQSVNQSHVYIRSFSDGPDGGGGPGLFLWGVGGAAFAGGLLGGFTGVALGSIAFFRPYPWFY